MTKNEMRKQMRLLREQVMGHEKMDYESRILALFSENERIKKSTIWYLYASYGSELSTWDIFSLAKLQKKRTAFPKVLEDGKTMEFYYVNNIEELQPGYHGILEPVNGILARDRGILLLPGLAFDDSGNRIGYGGGFYDRYLSRFPADHFFRVAIAYPFQVRKDLPWEEKDEKVDQVLWLPFS